MKTQEFLEIIEYTHAKIDALLKTIPKADLQSPGAAGNWSIAEILGHLTWYEKQMLQVISTRSLSGSDWWNLPLDERNALIDAEVKTIPIDRLLENYRTTFNALIAEIRTLRDDELNDTGAFTNMPAGWIPWQVIASNTFEHYVVHLEDIRRWKKGHQPDKEGK